MLKSRSGASTVPLIAIPSSCPQIQGLRTSYAPHSSLTTSHDTYRRPVDLAPSRNAPTGVLSGSGSARRAGRSCRPGTGRPHLRRPAVPPTRRRPLRLCPRALRPRRRPAAAPAVLLSPPPSGMASSGPSSIFMRCFALRAVQNHGTCSRRVFFIDFGSNLSRLWLAAASGRRDAAGPWKWRAGPVVLHCCRPIG